MSVPATRWSPLESSIVAQCVAAMPEANASPPTPDSNAAIVVQVDPGQPSPALEVNDQKISAAALQDTLKRLLQSHSDTPVLVKTSGLVAFGPIAHVIDTCHSIGAKVMLSTPLL